MYKWEFHHQNLKKEVVDLRRAKLEVGVDAVLILLVRRYTAVTNIQNARV
jgi:hypothetical protein